LASKPATKFFKQVAVNAVGRWVGITILH
jgi:hypothetical protein